MLRRNTNINVNVNIYVLYIYVYYLFKMNNYMKKQFYKVPLVKPSQRLQKQRQPEWKVCNIDDSEFKLGMRKGKRLELGMERERRK